MMDVVPSGGVNDGIKETEPSIARGYSCAFPGALGVHAGRQKKRIRGLSVTIRNAEPIKHIRSHDYCETSRPEPRLS